MVRSYDAAHSRQHGDGFRWLHESFGTNWRMTEMQAALGRVALTKVPRWVETRRRHANTLTKTLSGLPGLRIPTVPDSIHHAYYKYYVFLRPEMLGDGWDRDAIVQRSKRRECHVSSAACSEIYLEKAFVARRRHPTLPVARTLGETSLMFLVHPTLSDEHIAVTCRAIERVIAKAVKGSNASSQRPAARAGK